MNRVCNVKSCATCHFAFEEDMLKGRAALRCGANGNGTWYGRVTVTFPKGHKSAMEGLSCPAWCRSYMKEDSNGDPN